MQPKTLIYPEKKIKSGAIHGKDEVFCKVNGNRECAYRVPPRGSLLVLN